ncbi:ABC transporter permease [Govanella unica]|uniref:ABC transporter permease n=1 Tax=Govanella unica TaxID=2975056 RepID=A0A9X3Z6A1_9PROT|nr:ABC transporter permease [Govania unica]MDA5192916.1 ABC transporter permease [Govania unica]
MSAPSVPAVAAPAVKERTPWPAGLVLGLGVIAVLAALPVVLPWLGAPDADSINLYDRFARPGSEAHILGADHLGRDLLSRVAAGFDWSFMSALLATALSLAIGAPLGLLAADRPGWPRRVVLQIVNLTMSFPSLVAAICLIAIIGQGFMSLVLVLGLLTWPIFARIVYAESLSLLEKDYVIAARFMGVRQWRILFRHVLPALRPSLLAAIAFHFADMLIAESALSFLGIGAPLDSATWGNMLSDSRSFLYQAPWMMLMPAAAIVLVVVAANLIGDGVSTLLRGRSQRTL